MLPVTYIVSAIVSVLLIVKFPIIFLGPSVVGVEIMTSPVVIVVPLLVASFFQVVILASEIGKF